MSQKKLLINSEKVQYTNKNIFSRYTYHRNDFQESESSLSITPISSDYIFKTERRVPKTGLMLVGLAGNNGTTVVAGILANLHKIEWDTKEGPKKADFLGSVTQSATFKMADSKSGEKFMPFKHVLPLLNPTNLEISGWDISGDDLKTAMERAKVLHINLQKKLSRKMAEIKPLPSIYYADFIAKNQSDRANNVIKGGAACMEHIEAIRKDIREFKQKKNLDKVIVLWTANTERFCKVTKGVHDTEENFFKALKLGHSEISPSQIFAMASIMENCAYINGSPQNTFVPAIRAAAIRKNVFIAGNDFKSGQTKIKSVLVDFLVSAGIRPESIVSYNHLGNNDGLNLNDPRQFRSKECSKSEVIQDAVASNEILFNKRDHGTTKENRKGGVKGPDHVVVIKYVPHVGDSKRAMDEYTSSIFLGGKNTIVMHNTCEDSLLAAPIILDLVVLTEFLQRVSYCVLKTAGRKRVREENGVMHENKRNKKDGETVVENNSEEKEEFHVIQKLLFEQKKSRSESNVSIAAEKIRFEKMQSVLSALSYLMKAPQVPEGAPVVNSLFRQRTCLENMFRAFLGMQPESHMFLEHQCPVEKKIES